MEKTRWTMVISHGCNGSAVTRRVWKDAEGRYFVKADGKTWEVSFARPSFYVESTRDYRYAK